MARAAADAAALRSRLLDLERRAARRAGVDVVPGGAGTRRRASHPPCGSGGLVAGDLRPPAWAARIVRGAGGRGLLCPAALRAPVPGRPGARSAGAEASAC